MTQHSNPEIADSIQAAQLVIPCRELAGALDILTNVLGFRVDMIVPADAPQTAVISGYGVTLRLETAAANAMGSPPVVLRLLTNLAEVSAETAKTLQALEQLSGLRVVFGEAQTDLQVPPGAQQFVISQLTTAENWVVGRAGMQYRDLLPGRLGGRFIASHIRIPEGGAVPDYVHYHKVRFQMIYCKAGWVRVVYEDQGPPFVLQAGDCVLQPPEIRHRVLEASLGLEVIELGCPAIHETWADHQLSLPTSNVLPERLFNGQRFVRHVASSAEWQPWRLAGFTARETGIAAATAGLAAVRVIKPLKSMQPEHQMVAQHAGELLFWFVLQGELTVEVEPEGAQQLRAGDSRVIPARTSYSSQASADLELLEVTLPADLPMI
jgi:quercetin dioxygenase-like cupin family protein